MKKTLVFALAASIILGTHALSHARSEYMFGVKVGHSAPSNDFGKDFDGGLLYGIFGEVAFSPYLSLEGSLVRHNHIENEVSEGTLFPLHLQMAMFPDIAEEHFGGEKNLEINELTLNAKVYIPGTFVMPYVTAGAGVYFWAYDIENLGDNTETDFGVNGGGGLLIPITERIYLGADARYTHVWIQIGADEQELNYWNIVGTAAFGF